MERTLAWEWVGKWLAVSWKKFAWRGMVMMVEGNTNLKRRKMSFR